MDLHRARLTDPEVQPLLAALAEEYERRYGPGDEMATTSADEFDPPSGVFVVAVMDGQTVAGGGLRRLSLDTCEVKRMWTAPSHRRRGYALVVLKALEDAALDLGYTYLRAETGPAQPEALALYRRRGYREIPTYGPHEHAVAFETTLAGAGRRASV